MADWTRDAFRFAYPYGHYQGFPISIPKVIEADIIACRSRRVILDAEIVAWSHMFTDAPNLPPIETPVI